MVAERISDPLTKVNVSEKNGRILALDGIRGIAILAVMLFHFREFGLSLAPGGALGRCFATVAGLGWSGVDLFFVLSGFLITGILLDTRHATNYYRVFYGRRFVRIFPVFYVSLILLVPLRHVGADTAQVAAAWCYVLNWFIAVHGFAAASVLIQHFWSLCIEEQFYLVWPAVVRVCPTRRLWVVCWVVIGCAIATRVIAVWLHWSTFAYAATICRMDALAFGGIVAIAVREYRQWPQWCIRVAPVAGVLFLAVVAVTGQKSTFSPWMQSVGFALLLPIFGGLILLSLQPGTWANRVASLAPLRALGTYSYCLYVVHQPVAVQLSQVLAGRLHRGVWGTLVFDAAAFTVSMAIAIASWHLMESRFIALKRRPWLTYARN